MKTQRYGGVCCSSNASLWTGKVAQGRLHQPVVDRAAQQALHQDQARFSDLAVALVNTMGESWFQAQYCQGHTDEQDELPLTSSAPATEAQTCTVTPKSSQRVLLS